METEGFLGILPKYSGRFCGAVLYIISSLKFREKNPQDAASCAVLQGTRRPSPKAMYF